MTIFAGFVSLLLCFSQNLYMIAENEYLRAEGRQR